MSRISERIREILKLADSSKVVDKKKCVTALLDLYQNEDAIKEICQNTEMKGSTNVTWPYIMHVVHRLVLNEAEKPGKETIAKNNERQALSNLIINTVRQSNEKSTELLKSSTIVSMILQILDSKVYIHYQDTYLGILVKYILSKNRNHSNITAEQWKELLIVCTKLYKKVHLKKHIVVDALQMIVERSFPHANLLPDVKKLLPLLENIIEDLDANNEQLTEPFYKLSSSVCRQIITESRLMLCKFCENIVIRILFLNGSEEKYRLLLIILEIHHFEGISNPDDGAYAYDWDKWRDILRKMCMFILQNCKLDVQWPSFVQFASEVMKQILDNAANLTYSFEVGSLNNCYSQPSKRKRLMNKMENIIDLVMESNPEEVWPVLRILTETLRKYAHCLKKQDLVPLLQYLTELTQSRDESVMDHLYHLAIVLMDNEMSGGKEEQDTMIYWSKIWDMLFRSLGANQNEETGHSLVRCFIKHNRMPNANALLRLYLTKAIRWSSNSVHTLRRLCERVSLSEDVSESVLDPSPSATTIPISDRTRLLEWLLNVPWQKLVTRLSIETIEDICALLIDLILSSRCRQNVRTEQKSWRSHKKEREVIFVPHWNIYSMNLPRLCHASLTFKMKLSVCSKTKCVKQDFGIVSGNGNPVFYVQEAFDYLKKRLLNIFQEEVSNDENKYTVELHVVLMKIAFLARSLSILKQLGILTMEDIFDCSLISAMEKYVKTNFEILANIDWNRRKYMYLLSIARALNILYGATYDVDIANIIVSASTDNMLKNIYDLLNVDDNCHNYEEYDAFRGRRRRFSIYSESDPKMEVLPREGAISLQIVEGLASYCALDINFTKSELDCNKHSCKSELQMKMMRNLLSMQQDSTSRVYSRMSLTILESFATRDQREIQCEYADTPLEFFLKVCQKDRKDEESLRRLLNLLPYFFKYATDYNYSPKNIVYTLLQFYKGIRQRNCGILVHVDYMKCVCNFVRINPDFSWSRSKDFDDVTMLDSVLNYIGNTLFVLRSQAVRCLQELLSFKNVAHKWKEQIFVKVEEMVLKLLDEVVQQSGSYLQNNSLEEIQWKDEKETRTATALLALASVVCANGVLQGRALYTMLRLTMEKEVSTQTVEKVLSAAVQYTTTSVSLVEDNLNYLLTSWIEDAQYELQKFPYTLVGCVTLDEFFRKYVNHIVAILLRTSDFTEVVSFCTNYAGVTFEEIFEDFFPFCFVWLISRTTSDRSAFDNSAGQTLRKMVKNTDEFTNTCSFGRLFRDRLQDVLIELVRRLQDENDFKHVLLISGICFPAVDPPHFSRAIVDRCFDCLEQKFLEKPLTHALVEQPAVLQKTLMHLASAVHLSHSCEGKLKRLHQYVYFCSRLLRDLVEPVFDEMAAFLIRDVCYNLMHLTKYDDDILSLACCKFLDLFLRCALPVRATEVQDILKFVVTDLIGLAQMVSDISEVAANLIRFLVVEQRDVLQEAIAKLSSFPNHEIFREAREAHNAIRSIKGGAALLDDELERFLDSISEENVECTLEDLVNLTNRLLTKKRELRDLHRKLEKPYPNDGANILHRLIFKLIKLTESSNPRVSIEATRCLGELGPTDSTMALRAAGSLVRETDHAVEALTYRSVAMLINFIVKNMVELRKVSAAALYAVLSTSCGRKLCNSKYLSDLSNVLMECTPLKVEYIRPFARGRCVTQMSFSVDITRFHTVINPESALWIVKDNENYADWIVKVTCSITECFVDSYLESFLPVYRLSVEFCELILSRIVYLVIHRNDGFISAMCDCVNQFFRHHFVINHETENNASPIVVSGCDLKIVRRMLDVVNYMRMQLPDGVTLSLDYVYLARAAHMCSAYYTALLFAQLACESISMDYPDFSSDSRIDYIYERQPEVGRVLQRIMSDTYLNISDPDAICGAGLSHLLDHDSRMQYYARTNCWDKVMLSQDIELSHNSNHSSLMNARMEMANALHRSGLQFLQWRFLGDCLNEKFSYECAWRLSNWNLPVDNTVTVNQNDFQSKQSRLESLENAFHANHYHALKCFHENDRRGTKQAIEDARRNVICGLRAISLENSRIVNEKLSQLRLLREIEQLNQAADAPEENYSEVLRNWNEHKISLAGQLDYVEPILWQRIIIFRIRESLRMDVSVREAFFTTCLNLAEVAESQGDFSVAARALGILTTHQNLSPDLQNQLLYQESLLAWMKCDQVIARCLLRSLIEKKNPKPSLKAKALRVYGDWVAETKSENPQAVIQKYYLESIKTSEAICERTSDVIRNLHDTQIALARFADAQYEQISVYMKSPTYESLKEYARLNTTVEMDQAQIIENRDLKRAIIISHKQSTNDAAELKNIEQERRNYLALALKYYLKTLCSTEEHDMLVFRLMALWLDNMSDDKVNEELLDELDTVPSFKFVPLVPQLAAHVSNDIKQQRSFSARIFEILKRCALEHPYHTLPVVLALKNLHSDDEYDSGSSKIAKKEERRVLGAKKLLQQLTKSPVSVIVCEMENLSRALLSFAYWQPKGKCYSGKCYQIPRDQSISKIRDLNNVLLPTLNLPVRPSGNYNNVIGVRSYQETCEFVGGLTAPKKIICVGTDGMHYRQLVKGKDDLRQDAVMQQVFTVMNTLLRTCKETKRRNLRIRTYKVVPLTQRSGVLEWCDNTVPIIATLVGTLGTPGMHKRYYPRDLTAVAARDKMIKVAQGSNEMKLKVFLDCCKRMKPAFHHFFEEKYRSPEIWVERTLTYTRSVATTSIAGYILGLGDRHLSNILIDERTAEVIHIDFGIAFEQGKVLPCPETIPFRLTRDIEVAMGASGIEGTMRRSCEVTMTMLRYQRQIIITLLQVLLYDPLFTWTITVEKAYKMQGNVVKGFSDSGRASVETNTIAKRALLRIEQKLQGTEDGLVSSVSGQVERLLQEARDPANLCRVYCGWQPYL